MEPRLDTIYKPLRAWVVLSTWQSVAIRINGRRQHGYILPQYVVDLSDCDVREFEGSEQ